MALPNSKVDTMSPIDDKENSFENETDYFIPDAEGAGSRKRKSRLHRISRFWIWMVHAILFAANIYGIAVTLRIVGRENSMNPMRAPIRHKTWMMFDEKEIAPYQAINGSTNDAIDRQWNTLLDIGGVKMNKAAKDRLLKDTAQIYGEDMYAGILEFEHQLHCLNRIRKVFYGSTLEELGGTLANFTAHNDHCFQYLRQTLMCHADLQVMSMTRFPEVNGYIPDFDVVKQCRDFDIIHEWAQGLQDIDQDAVDGSRDPTTFAHRPHPHAGHGH